MVPSRVLTITEKPNITDHARFLLSVFLILGRPNIQRRETMIAEDRPYYLKIYGLDVAIDLKPGVGRDTLMEMIDGPHSGSW